MSAERSYFSEDFKEPEMPIVPNSRLYYQHAPTGNPISEKEQERIRSGLDALLRDIDSREQPTYEDGTGHYQYKNSDNTPRTKESDCKYYTESEVEWDAHEHILLAGFNCGYDLRVSVQLDEFFTKYIAEHFRNDIITATQIRILGESMGDQDKVDVLSCIIEAIDTGNEIIQEPVDLSDGFQRDEEGVYQPNREDIRKWLVSVYGELTPEQLEQAVEAYVEFPEKSSELEKSGES